MSAPGPPKPAEEIEREAEEALDAMDDADVETPDGVQPRDDVGDPDEILGESPVPEEEPEEPEVDLADIDVGEEVDGDSPFDTVDDATGGGGHHDDRGSWDGTDPGEQSWSEKAKDAGDATEPFAEGDFADIINNGSARFAVMGLPEEFEHGGELKTKEGLQDEFVEVFETFHLGQFGEQSAEKYLDFEGEDVDPAVGLAISMVICSFVVLQMRPDGDEIMYKMRRKAGGLR